MYNLLSQVNYLAVLVCGIVYEILGMIWYGSLFGKVWAEANGIKIDPKSREEMKKEMFPMMFGSFLAALVASAAFAVILLWGSVTSLMAALWLVLFIWIAFNAFPLLATKIYAKKSWTLFWIDSIFSLIYFMIVAAILFSWK